MHLNHKLFTRALGTIALIAMGACRDTVAPSSRTLSPPALSPAILDGAHGGNTSVFFLPPMVSNPTGQPGFGDPVRAGLPVSFQVEQLSDGTTTCPSTIVRKFATSQVQFLSDHYQADWHTDDASPALKVQCNYRIEVFVGSQMEAFADVDVVTNAGQLKNVKTQELIPLVDGRTLPIKVRIEQGVTFCSDPSCVSVVVSNKTPTLVVTPNGQNAAQFPAGWFSEQTLGTDQVIVTIEDISSQVNASGGPGCGLGLTKMVSPDLVGHPTHCVRFSTEPRVKSITAEVVVAVCQEDRGDIPQLLLKYDVGEAPKFLRNVRSPIVCPEEPRPTGTGSTTKVGRVVHYASVALSHAGRALQSIFGPREANAFDLGVGGSLGIGDGFSVIAAGHPIGMFPISGDGQSGPAGQILDDSPTIQLRYLHRDDGTPTGPNDAIVTCTVVGNNGHLAEEGDVLQGRAQHFTGDDADGIYHCPGWRPGAGDNTIEVTANGLDDVVIVGGQERQFTGKVQFHAFGTIPGGNDLVVFGDANIFDNVQGADGNNQQLFRNLLNFRTLSPRSAGTHVSIDCSHGTLPAYCLPGTTFQTVVGGVGYTVDAGRTLPTPIPANVKLVVLAPPTQTFTTAEIAALQSFASAGGRIVFLAENVTGDLAGQTASLNSVRVAFGFPPLPLSGPGSFACAAGGSVVIPGTQFSNSVITAGVSQLSVNCVSLIEPWGGSALFSFIDGDVQRTIGAVISLAPVIQ